MSLTDIFSLQGKNALVTGGNKGLGKGISFALAEAGANIAVAGRDLPAAERVSTEISTSFNVDALPIKADVMLKEEVEEMFAASIGYFKHIDIIVSNAGITNQPRQNAWEIEDELWNRIFDVNLKGMYLVCTHGAKHMIKRKSGKIICMGSMVSVVAQPGHAPYIATKGGISQLTKALALDLAPFNIQVNALGPGYFRSEITQKSINDPKKLKRILGDVPLKKIGEPEDLAGAAIFLSSSASDYMTGHLLVIDGGYTIH